MGDKTGIHWTDALLPVALLVAADAKGLDVKPVNAVVSKEMMIVLGRNPAVKARELFGFGECSAPNSSADGITRSVLNFHRWWRDLAFSPDRHATTVNASCRKAVASAPINVKTDCVSPGPAFEATLQTTLLGQVPVLNVDTQAFGMALDRPFSTAHCIVSPLSNGNNYTTRSDYANRN